MLRFREVKKKIKAIARIGRKILLRSLRSKRFGRKAGSAPKKEK